MHDATQTNTGTRTAIVSQRFQNGNHRLSAFRSPVGRWNHSVRIFRVGSRREWNPDRIVAARRNHYTNAAAERRAETRRRAQPPLTCHDGNGTAAATATARQRHGKHDTVRSRHMAPLARRCWVQTGRCWSTERLRTGRGDGGRFIAVYGVPARGCRASSWPARRRRGWGACQRRTGCAPRASASAG